MVPPEQLIVSSNGNDSLGVDSSRALLGRIQSIREDLSHMSQLHGQLRDQSNHEMTKTWIQDASLTGVGAN